MRSCQLGGASAPPWFRTLHVSVTRCALSAFAGAVSDAGSRSGMPIAIGITRVLFVSSLSATLPK